MMRNLPPVKTRKDAGTPGVSFSEGKLQAHAPEAVFCFVDNPSTLSLTALHLFWRMFTPSAQQLVGWESHQLVYHTFILQF